MDMQQPESIGPKNPENANPQQHIIGESNQPTKVTLRPAAKQEVGTEALAKHKFTNVKNTKNAAADNQNQRMDNVFKNAPKVVFEK